MKNDDEKVRRARYIHVGRREENRKLAKVQISLHYEYINNHSHSTITGLDAIDLTLWSGVGPTNSHADPSLYIKLPFFYLNQQPKTILHRLLTYLVFFFIQVYLKFY